MFKKFIPFAIAKSIYDIDIEFFKFLKIKTLLVDLDNTLDSYRLSDPTSKAYELKKKMDENGIEIIIVSNNSGKRVKSYATKLGVPYIKKAYKPFPCKINKLIKSKNLYKKDIIFIGDQMMTDVLAANRAGLRVIFCEKIVDEDQLTTKFNRIFEKIIKNYHKKHHNFIEWREIYGQN